MWRASPFGVAVIAFLALPAFAQDSQTILYDANGRVVGVTTARASGNSAWSSYVLDDADNRIGRAAAAVTPPPTANKLAFPYTLVPTQKLTSANGQYTLTLEPSGDLVLRSAGGALIWNSCTGQGRSVYTRVASTGPLTIYDTGHVPMWSAGASGNPGAELTLENSGTAVLRSSGGAVLWSSTTPCA